MPQGPSVLWDLTVRENLDAFRRDRRASAAEDAARAPPRGSASQQRLDVRAGDLSGGERRRLELARAVTRLARASSSATSPSPGWTPRAPPSSATCFAAWPTAGAAVFLADHHVAEALRVCTRALLLLDGAVAVSAPAGDFADDPLVRGRYLGTLAAATPRPTRLARRPLKRDART